MIIDGNFNYLLLVMIKLKELITEAIEPIAIKLYWNFVLNALSGRNPDDFYRQYKLHIDSVIDALVKKYGPTVGGEAYRGIILDPSEVKDGKVNHVPHITYVSFSEERKIALAFADIQNSMWDFGKTRYPNSEGYLITCQWRPEHLMFHYKWMDDTNMWPVAEHFFGSDVKYIKMQKELILKPRPYYRVIPVSPGTSDNLEVGT